MWFLRARHGELGEMAAQVVGSGFWSRRCSRHSVRLEVWRSILSCACSWFVVHRRVPSSSKDLVGHRSRSRMSDRCFSQALRVQDVQSSTSCGVVASAGSIGGWEQRFLVGLREWHRQLGRSIEWEVVRIGGGLVVQPCRRIWGWVVPAGSMYACTTPWWPRNGRGDLRCMWVVLRKMCGWLRMGSGFRKHGKKGKGKVKSRCTCSTYIMSMKLLAWHNSQHHIFTLRPCLNSHTTPWVNWSVVSIWQCCVASVGWQRKAKHRMYEQRARRFSATLRRCPTQNPSTRHDMCVCTEGGIELRYNCRRSAALQLRIDHNDHLSSRCEIKLCDRAMPTTDLTKWYEHVAIIRGMSIFFSIFTFYVILKLI